jgi:hypothetical protein
MSSYLERDFQNRISVKLNFLKIKGPLSIKRFFDQ